MGKASLDKESFPINYAYKVKLNITDKRILGFLKQQQGASAKAYNYAVAQSLEDHKKWSPVREAYKAELTEKYKDDPKAEELIQKDLRAFSKANAKNYLRSSAELRKEFTYKYNTEKDLSWIKEVDAVNVCGTIYLDFDRGLQSFHKNIDANIRRVQKRKEKEIARGTIRKYEYPYNYGYPQFKKSHKKHGFLISNIPVSAIDFENHKVRIPKLSIYMKEKYGVKHDGYVKIWHGRKLPITDEICRDMIDKGLLTPKNANQWKKVHWSTLEYSNCRITTDGVDWYLSLAFHNPGSVRPEEDNIERYIIGIDTGIKSAMVTSDGDVVPNYASDKEYKKLEIRYKKLQKLINRKITKWAKKAGVTYQEMSKKVHKRETMPRVLKDLYAEQKLVQVKKNNYIEYRVKKAISQILSKNPSLIIIEELRVKGMMKNKKLSAALQKTGMSKILTTLANACAMRGIPIYKAHQDAEFASSQLCSSCGYKHTDMKNLGERTFVCPNCGMVLDRDLNAAINMRDAWYKHPTKLIEVKGTNVTDEDTDEKEK